MFDLEKLRAEAKQYQRHNLGVGANVVIELLDHIAALDKDAGRYRYLRGSSKKELWDGLMNTFPFATEAFDQKIDTAMEVKHG